MDYGISLFELSKNWIPALWRALSKIRSDRRSELDTLTNVFGDPVELAKFYVEPDCQQVNPADYAEDEAIVREPLFRRLQTFISGDASRTNNQLFILSDAGMGKTSALLMFKLAHLFSFWPKGYECVLLKLGPATVSTLEQVADKRKTVLLLDALDEDPQAWGRIPQRLRDLLQASKSFFRTVITCRTQFFEARHDPFNNRGQVEVAGFICPVIYASLFNDSQVLAYIAKRFPTEAKDQEWVARASGMVRRMGFLRMRPMLLAHLPDLMESRETVWNEYSIYRAMVDAWLLREQRKAPTADDSYASRLKRACRYAAVQLHASGRRYFSRKEADVLMAAISSDATSPLDLSGRSLLNKDSDGNFRFSHFSVQEFLVLEYLLAGGAASATRRELRVTDFMNQLGAAWIIQAESIVRKDRDLSFMDLRRANFDRTALADLVLRKLDLSNISFNDASLINSTFGSSTLVGASFRGAQLTNVDFRNCNLASADFSGAVLVDCAFDAAKLYGALFSGATSSRLTASFASYDTLTVWESTPTLLDLGAEFKPALRKVVDDVGGPTSGGMHAGVDDE